MELTVRGAKTYAATGGKDFNPDLPTVLFIHGSGLDHRSWALQTRWFAFHGYSVLAPDLPGHSLSGGEPLATIEESGAWLSEFLEAAGVKAVHAVGHSQGVLSALELARQAPEKVMSLSAIGSAAAIPVNPALIETAKTSAPDAAEMMCNWGFGPGIHRGISPVPGMQPIALGRRIMGANPLAVDLQACAGYVSGQAVAESLDIPALCILAAKDKMTPMRGGRALADALGAEVVILENFGHMVPIEAPKQTLQALRNFIEGVQNSIKDVA